MHNFASSGKRRSCTHLVMVQPDSSCSCAPPEASSAPECSLLGRDGFGPRKAARLHRCAYWPIRRRGLVAMRGVGAVPTRGVAPGPSGCWGWRRARRTTVELSGPGPVATAGLPVWDWSGAICSAAPQAICPVLPALSASLSVITTPPALPAARLRSDCCGAGAGTAEVRS